MSLGSLSLPLTAHPTTPPRTIERISVHLTRMPGGGLTLKYQVTPVAQLKVPDKATPERANDLWRTTCFEMFAKEGIEDGYREFNFSPSLRWAAYVFDGYRAGMRDLSVFGPNMSVEERDDTLTLNVDGVAGFSAEPVRLNLTAVIEEIDGTKSYWALAHPDGPPDFHDPACFVLELPAPR